jgi:hypothetical protein
MTRKLSVILTVLMLGAILLVACSPVAPAAPTETPQALTQVICNSDMDCFLPHFLACASSVWIMTSAEGNSYIITVFGKENGLCHYGSTVVDKKGKVPPGMVSTDCRVPIEKITKDTFDHFFGQNTRVSIKTEQNKIENDYCVKK